MAPNEHVGSVSRWNVLGRFEDIELLDSVERIEKFSYTVGAMKRTEVRYRLGTMQTPYDVG